MPTNQSLNVGLVFDDSLDRPDGVANYVKNLGAWLSLQGHSVSYLVGETKLSQWQGGKVYSLSKNLTVSFNGNKLSIPLPGAGRKIKKFMSSNQFDILHVMVPYSPFMAARVIKTASPGCAVIGTFHIFPSGTISKAGSIILKQLLRPTLKEFDQIVSVSQASADFAKPYYGINPQVVPNPVETGKYEGQTVKRDKNLIVFLGRLVKRKGASQLIEAFSVLAGKNPEAKLVIAGDGPDRPKLEARVKKLGLKDRVSFLGYIKEEEKPELLASATVACFPSLYGEAFGIVLIEAMAAANPVVLAGDNPGYRSVLGAKPDLLINPYHKTQFADRLNLLLTDETKRQKIKDWQAQEVKRYDINIVGQQIMEIYNSAIARLDKKSHNKHHG